MTIYSIQSLPKSITLGIQTETGVRKIGFDVRPWIKAYGHLEFSIWPTLPGESAAYPAANIDLIDGMLIWTPNNIDTHTAGQGQVEIIAVADHKRKLSGICNTIILPTSLPAETEAPDAYKPWVDQVIKAAAHANEASENAYEYAELAQQGAANAGYMQFEIGDDGRLYMYRTENVDIEFALEEGRLVIYG